VRADPALHPWPREPSDSKRKRKHTHTTAQTLARSTTPADAGSAAPKLSPDAAQRMDESRHAEAMVRAVKTGVPCAALVADSWAQVLKTEVRVQAVLPPSMHTCSDPLHQSCTIGHYVGRPQHCGLGQCKHHHLGQPVFPAHMHVLYTRSCHPFTHLQLAHACSHTNVHTNTSTE
jgi:hypothetical protein